MQVDPSDRNSRIAELIEGSSIGDLRRTALQAIDHAYKTSAEVAEAWATYEGAQGMIAELTDENRALRQRLGDLESRLDRLTSSPARRVGAALRNRLRAIARRPSQ